MKTNQELLEEANKIDFKLTKTGCINFHKHNRYERGLFFVKKAIELHGINTYQYGLVPNSYTEAKTNVPIVCQKHGEFLVTPDNHVGKASGCPKCSHTYMPATDEWIRRAKAIHGDLCDYSGVEYMGAKIKVRISCRLHGTFEQTPDLHIRGTGCPQCAGHNHDILYLLRCKDTGWYKIGITTTNTKNRINQIGGNIEEVFHVVCNDPRKHESILHKKYDRDREYNLCVKDGNTEFFSLNEAQVKQIIDYMSSIAINQSIN